ncbi:hypothetical protein [Curtobacterium sp. ZW137]|uniref:hypothetical protein n=1 Tax=Curtobacterium sp. ZW137 TaxID=2485104 RepID=UPI000F4C9D0A|nr:hypothetical protein [Curtobacterium sp. ZW137]ROP65859.1 hypothetical protein EDF55_0302 [Curtobacterium sp. ZW137]
MRRAMRAAAVGLAVVVLASGCATPPGPPPWPRPTDLAARAEAAGLHDVWGQRLAEHIHTHLTITDGGEPVVVPGNIGHSAKQRFAAEIHTHDTSGIVHVESPERRTFTLGQFFDEWDVSLGPAHVGGLHGDLTVWVDGRRYYANPRSIELRDLEQVDLVVTTIGEVPHRPPAFDWPPQYH